VEEIQQAKRNKRGRPPKDDPAPEGQAVYRLSVEIVSPSEEARIHFLHRETAFVLLTDIRDDQRLTDTQVLRLYRNSTK
jgi:hypothetical protein